MNWLYIHLPHLYGETWLADFHSSQPMALTRAQGQQIDAINPAARTCGVDIDMSLSTAFCLCPQLRASVLDARRQRRALQRAAAIAARHCAWVAEDPPCGIYLEIASMAKLLGRALQAQSTLQQVFQQRGYSAVIAAAPNPKAARLLARAGRSQCCDQRQFERCLGDIPVTALGIDAKTELRLAKLGLASVEDLARLPHGDLSYRVDTGLALYVDRISGRQTWLPPPFQAPEQFRWQLDLEQDFDSLEPLRFFLAKGIGEFCHFLQQRCLAAQALQLTLLHRRRPPTNVDVRLAAIDNRPESWQYMLSNTVNRLQLEAPIIAMQLRASVFEALDRQERQLFKSVSQESGEKKSQLLNRLGARLGMGRIHFLQISTDPRPEYQTVYASQAAVQKHRPPAGRNTPLWLAPQPLPTDIDQYTISRGPLRLNTGWWDRNGAHRDYYIASHTTLSTQWVFRQPSGLWYIHGWFA